MSSEPSQKILRFNKPEAVCSRRLISMVFPFGLILVIYTFPGIEFNFDPDRPNPALDRWLLWTTTFISISAVWLFIVVPLWASRDKPTGTPRAFDERMSNLRRLLWIPLILWVSPVVGCICTLAINVEISVWRTTLAWIIWHGGLVFWIGTACLGSKIITQRKQRAKEAETHCKMCGYDLASLAERQPKTCPECDSPIRGAYQHAPITLVDSTWPHWTLKPLQWRYVTYAILAVGMVIICFQPAVWKEFRPKTDPWLPQALWVSLFACYATSVSLWFTSIRYWNKINTWQRQSYRPKRIEITNWAEQSVYAFILLVILFVGWAAYLSSAWEVLNKGVIHFAIGAWWILPFVAWMITLFIWNIVSTIHLKRRVLYHCHCVGHCYHCGCVLPPNQHDQCPECKIQIANVSTDKRAAERIPSTDSLPTNDTNA